MGAKRCKPEEIISKLREAEVLLAEGVSWPDLSRWPNGSVRLGSLEARPLYSSPRIRIGITEPPAPESAAAIVEATWSAATLRGSSAR